MKFDDSQIDRIERNIAPPLSEAITLPAGDGIVVYVGRDAFGADRSQAKELKSIARQIVASGELLEALKAIVDGAEKSSPVLHVEEIYAAYDAARAAIAKAEGRSRS